MTDKLIYKEESYAIIGAAMEVHRHIGCGFNEVVYQEALEHEFCLRGIPYEREKTFHVIYKGKELDKEFRVDFVCYDEIIVELKAVDSLTKEFTSQVFNYLKASNCELGLLINFGKSSLEHKRIIAQDKWYNEE